MPRLRVPDEELNIKELEDAEYDDREFDYESYDGELPPADTYLDGYVKKMWWCYTGGGDPMLKALFIADGNDGDEEEYDGLPVWEQLPLTNVAKFKWKPFIDVFGLRLIDIKRKTMVADDDDRIGAPIERIGNWEPGEGSRCRILTKRAKFNGKDKVEVRRWLDASDDAEEELEDYDEDEDEEVEQAPPPRRTRPAAAKPAKPAARPAKAAKPATKAAPAKTTRSRRVSSQAGYDEEPPF